MSEKDVKATRHNVIVSLLCDKAILYDQAVFKLAKSIDPEELGDNGLVILGYDLGAYLTPDPTGVNHKKENEEKKDGNKNKLMAAVEGSHGALSKIYAKLKGAGWKKLYTYAAAGILLAVLLGKWIGRILTGTFI